MSIGIAILGAGDFVRDEHVPAIHACPLLTLKAVYSRSKPAAQKISQAEDIDWYYDRPATPPWQLDDLLARQDIHAVVIAVPLLIQSGLIKKALSAGKHVLSEKPIAEDVKTAERLIEWYRSTRREELWSVAENFRFLPGIILAADELRKIGGSITSFGLILHGFMGDDDHGDGADTGIIIDSGVHVAAGLRALLQATSHEISSLTANTSHESHQFIDTIHSTIQLRNGASGTCNIALDSALDPAFAIVITTDRGEVMVKADKVICQKKGKDGKKIEETTEVGLDSGVKAEVRAFAESIHNGVADERGAPEQALADLKLIQRMLESGEHLGAVKVLL